VNLDGWQSTNRGEFATAKIRARSPVLSLFTGISAGVGIGTGTRGFRVAVARATPVSAVAVRPGDPGRTATRG